ncbi:MAG: PilT/PilU family type 4a pilus ATPase [Verrucomicrobia bacterium]|nr:PilT/PilU family type 4a pilus ATPase [Verrucomicrobiota bacterium]
MASEAHHAPTSEAHTYFNSILKLGVDTGCSDVHIKAGSAATYRISRQLRSTDFIATQEWMEEVIMAITPSHMKAALLQDRETDFSYHCPGVGRFRTNVFQQCGKWAIVMRYVKNQVPTFEKLGLPDLLRQIVESPRGIFLMVGTTGSGKSTTLAAMLEHVNESARKHIVTLEDPIEFIFEENQCVIEQREVLLDTQSFQRGLKSALRQDPDIIMVGEMRDAISFQAAISAADTGTMVISTMHTTSASSSVGRILEFFKQDERDTVRRQLAGTLRAVVAQRMCPTIDGKMTPACEIMVNSITVRKAIEENQLNKLPQIIEASEGEGMQSFNQAVYKLCMEGRISKEVALEKANNAQAVNMMFEGFFKSGGGIVG